MDRPDHKRNPAKRSERRLSFGAQWRLLALLVAMLTGCAGADDADGTTDTAGAEASDIGCFYCDDVAVAQDTGNAADSGTTSTKDASGATDPVCLAACVAKGKDEAACALYCAADGQGNGKPDAGTTGKDVAGSDVAGNDVAGNDVAGNDATDPGPTDPTCMAACNAKGYDDTFCAPYCPAGGGKGGK